MAIGDKAKFIFGLSFVRLMALNADQTRPTPARMIGGGEPFDFSSADSANAVPLTVKIDSTAPETTNVDLSTAGDIAAVTGGELVAAINAAGPTDITASIDGKTERVKLVCSTADAKYVQVYGVCARLAGFGQGIGLKFVKSDTVKSLNIAPTLKEGETFTTTPADGKDTEIIGDGYRKGFTGTIVDAAEDPAMRELIEGGIYTVAADGKSLSYESPNLNSKLVYFFIQAFYAQYAEGPNKEADQVGYRMDELRSCTGTVGDTTHERGFTDANYPIVGVSYRDEDGNLHGDQLETYISTGDYEALDLPNV